MTPDKSELPAIYLCQALSSPSTASVRRIWKHFFSRVSASAGESILSGLASATTRRFCLSESGHDVFSGPLDSEISWAKVHLIEPRWFKNLPAKGLHRFELETSDSWVIWLSQTWMSISEVQVLQVQVLVCVRVRVRIGSFRVQKKLGYFIFVGSRGLGSAHLEYAASSWANHVFKRVQAFKLERLATWNR